MLRGPQSLPFFPYTTLFRSDELLGVASQHVGRVVRPARPEVHLVAVVGERVVVVAGRLEEPEPVAESRRRLGPLVHREVVQELAVEGGLISGAPEPDGQGVVLAV